MPRYGFVADDVTGAGDVLAQAHRHGLDAVLLVGDGALPADADVVGIAGPARSLAGPAFDQLVSAHLDRIAGAEPEVLLYKVCSTFDSSPTTGSIGRGIELLRRRYPEHGPVPVAPAQPDFGRYTAFSDHYATHDGRVYRLDRHPVMSCHPSTPMHDADLRQLLVEQLTDGAGVGELQLPAHADGFTAAWHARRADAGDAAFVVDATANAHLDTVARALLADGSPGAPALVIGSGGMMTALARAVGRPSPEPSVSGASGPVLAVSASASAVTADQIDDATAHGWASVPIPIELLHDPRPAGMAALARTVCRALAAGRSVVVHTARGPRDSRLDSAGGVSAASVGRLLGELVAQATSSTLTRDVAVFGGDTASHALLAMGVERLRVAHQFVTAGPVLKTDDRSAAAGCRLLLKGGQVGPPDILRRFAGDPEVTPPHGTTAHESAATNEREDA